MAKRVTLLLYWVSLTLSAFCVVAESSVYTIREGETLFGIARKVRIPIEVLCAFNGIDDPGRLKAGTQIHLPRPYTVKKGDTLYSISRAFSIPLQKLMSVNALRDSSLLKAGATLFIPIASERYATVTNGGAGADPGPGTSSSGASAAKDQTNATRSETTPWPHPGRHEPFQGKISGLVFYGKQGDGVVSASDGEVKWVGPYWGLGKTVIIKNGEGLVFIYAGNEELLVNVGDRVKPGMEIARLGVSPQGGGAKLYFCIEAEGKFMDPERFFSKI
jgi:murein DD-endopeptidase MepM/ murein hydrolase activator NlpD